MMLTWKRLRPSVIQLKQHVKAYFSNKIEQVKEVEIDKLKKEEIFEALNESKESILEDIKASGMLKREVRKLAQEVSFKG